MTTELVPVAALFVDARGVYSTLPGVDVWGVERDARLYTGTARVVAHPPCQRWGRYAAGGPSHHGKFTPGDDGGCFAAALAAVRRCGGVLEHPAVSLAWATHGLSKPPKAGSWMPAGDGIGWTCHVEQGHYGHLGQKPTWLYAVGIVCSSLRWGPSSPPELPPPPCGTTRGWVERLSKRRRAATPVEFAELLVALARSGV